MAKVTVIVETDDQYTQIARQGDDLGVLLAQCIAAAAETYNSKRLDEIAEAASAAARRRPKG